jgi:hypothetical protein
MQTPDFHDGSLTGIILPEAETLELRCADVNGRRYILRLPQLVSLRADNFREGNIILDASVYESDFPPELIKKVFGEDANGEPAWLAGRIEALREGSWTLLELTSSYGCELLALARGRLSVERCQ